MNISAQSIHSKTQSYTQEIPADTKKAMIGSFVITLLFYTVIHADPRLALLRAATSAVASAVYGLITPLFRDYCGKNHLSYGQELCKRSIAVVGASYFAALLGDFNVFRTLFAHCAINGLFQSKEHRQNNKSPLFLI